MLSKFIKMMMVVALAIVITLLWTGGAVAQDLAGTGPDYAMTPTDDVMTIEEGEYHWYVFNYDFWQGKHTREMEPMEIRLYSFPIDGATLTLRNENQAERWRQDGVQEHFGCCTLQDLDNEDTFDADGKTDYAVWSGKLSSGRYYIVVEHAKNIQGPVTYQFTMSGDGFFYDDPVPIAPAEAAPPAEPVVVEELALEVEPEAVSVSPLLGTGPDYAMRPSGETKSLRFGEYHWYAFTYDFWEGKHTREMEPMEIQLFSDPIEGATLTLRNEHQAELWRQDGKHEHFGCCTLKDFGGEKTFDPDGKEDFATWSGKLSSGRYYIVVEHAKNFKATVTYRFTITGDGVLFDDEVMAAAPALPAESAEPIMVEELALEVEPAAAAPAPLMGTGPDLAMRPTDEVRTIYPGEYHWFTFDYDFWEGKHTHEMEPMEIRLYSEPFEGATLTLRNKEQAQLWRNDGEHAHFGCCTPEAFIDENFFDVDGKTDYAVWAGKLTSGKYYIVIEHAKNMGGPVTYRFTLAGDGFTY